jgi:hypothetical protein
MSDKSHLTTGEIAAKLGVPGWAVRRAVDALGEDISRAGLYRLVPSCLLARIKAEIEKGALREVASDAR